LAASKAERKMVRTVKAIDGRYVATAMLTPTCAPRKPAAVRAEGSKIQDQVGRRGPEAGRRRAVRWLFTMAYPERLR